VDPISKDGGFGFSPQVLQDWTSDRDTTAIFAELVMFPTENVEIDLAARYEDTLGVSSTEPKISMLWTPTDRLFVRATAGSSFRLASEIQLFGVGPGTPPRPTIGGEVTQAVAIAEGTPSLLPEESDNYTVGFDYDVTDNFTVGLTYWSYDFTNLVTQTDLEQQLLADLADGWVNADGPGPLDPVRNAASPHPLFAGRPNEVCEVTGRWAGPGSGTPLPGGCITGFDFEIFRASFLNQNVVETSGIDLTLDWRKAFSNGGEFGVRFVGAYTAEYLALNENGVLVDAVGTDGFNVASADADVNPELIANVINTYSRGNHSFRATWRYSSGIERTNPNNLLDGWDSGSYVTLDLNYNYDLPTSNPSTLSIAVLNASDELPPLTPNGLITYNAGLYDGRGRLFRLMYNMGF
jgi:outer membrane receptor protein involved in Fe transport